ncbi:hypothetical protein, partial [Klebsiella pneumoniae]|uniref:hypothetical protein n=1 Tax=Klebsiella pneumoniae TaxID=573 RepID=UPI0025A13D8A
GDGQINYIIFNTTLEVYRAGIFGFGSYNTGDLYYRASPTVGYHVIDKTGDNNAQFYHIGNYTFQFIFSAKLIDYD